MASWTTNRSRTIYLFRKQAKVHFRNEQTGISEFKVQCLEKQSKTKRESMLYCSSLCNLMKNCEWKLTQQRKTMGMDIC